MKNSNFILILLLSLTPLNSIANNQDLKFSEHEQAVDAFLEGFRIKEYALKDFEQSKSKIMERMKNNWENKPEVKSCLNKHLSPKDQYKNITLESYKSVYKTDQANTAYRETQTDFTQKFLNIIFRASLMGKSPSQEIQKHISENQEAYKRFEANIQPKLLKRAKSLFQPLAVKSYYAKIINICNSNS